MRPPLLYALLSFVWLLLHPTTQHTEHSISGHTSATLPPSAFPSFVSVPRLVEPGHESPGTDLDTMPCTIVLENLIGRPFSR